MVDVGNISNIIPPPFFLSPSKFLAPKLLLSVVRPLRFLWEISCWPWEDCKAQVRNHPGFWSSELFGCLGIKVEKWPLFPLERGHSKTTTTTTTTTSSSSSSFFFAFQYQKYKALSYFK